LKRPWNIGDGTASSRSLDQENSKSNELTVHAVHICKGTACKPALKRPWNIGDGTASSRGLIQSGMPAQKESKS